VPHVVALSGPTTVSVDLGSLADSDSDGKEQVPTEMLQLELQGVSPDFGPVKVRLRDSALDPFNRTLGQIEESANLIPGTLDLPPFNPNGPAADSFFDVYVEVELPNLGMVLHTHQPKHMFGLIRYKPPTWGDWYESPVFVPLYDAAEILVAELAPSIHVPNPCQSNSQCGDNNACTDDTCDPVTGRCVFTPTAPPETQNVTVAADKATYSWSATPLATRYDVVRGSTGAFPVGPGGGDEACFDNLAGPTVVDPLLPPAGAGFWYLSRGENACGLGTYGTRSNGLPRTTTTCP